MGSCGAKAGVFVPERQTSGLQQGPPDAGQEVKPSRRHRRLSDNAVQEAGWVPIKRSLSRFDATDLARDQRAQLEGDAEGRVRFFDDKYHGGNNLWVIAKEITDWADPIGVIWPEAAIERLHGNCELMVDQHSGGETSTVVLPLFLYTAIVYRHRVWAEWVPSDSWGIVSLDQDEVRRAG
eukprot:Hpha_TRINITY_DN28045_c0_g1::TRINITY_DN28045_c0_g1_i1::g.42597::m.42597